MKNILLLLYALLFQLSALKAQNLAAWQNRDGSFNVYDNGQVKSIFHQEIPFFNVKGDHMIYRDIKNDTYLYSQGNSARIESYINDENLLLTNHYLFGLRNQLLMVRSDATWHTLSLERNPIFSYGDSLVVFIDYNGLLKYYYRNKILQMDNWGISELKASDNSFAFTTENRQIFFVKDLEEQEVENEGVHYFWVGQNYLLYINDYNRLILYKDGEITDLCKFSYNDNFEIDKILPTTSRVWAGDSLFAFIDDDLQLIAYDGNKTVLLHSDYKFPLMGKDNTLIYRNDNNGLSVYYNGKDYEADKVYPKNIKFADGVVAYQDAQGYLKAFYEGKNVQVSEGLLPQSSNVRIGDRTKDIENFEVFGRVIIYRTTNFDVRVFHEGVLRY